MDFGKFISPALLISLLGTGVAYAQEPEPADVVVYINPLEYKHPVKLWHFYYDYWYTQGPAVEAAAVDVLNAAYGKASMCDGNNIGKTLVRIVPNMFYNPHMTMFYGKLRAEIFTGSGKPLGAYVTEVQRLGFLDVAPADQIGAIYRTAMQNVVDQMKADAAVQEAIKNGVPHSETSTPCSMMAVLPSRRVNANDLLNTFER
jgi:hypothetical protein